MSIYSQEYKNYGLRSQKEEYFLNIKNEYCHLSNNYSHNVKILR